MGTKLLTIDLCEGHRQFLFEALELGGKSRLEASPQRTILAAKGA